MPINQETKTAFVHIPRNGGTYIEHIMGIHKERPNSGFGGNYNHSGDLEHLFGRNMQHLGFVDIIDLLGDKATEYHWFTTIRNPQDRIISIICHRLRCPEALTSILKLCQCLLRIVRTWISFYISNLKKDILNFRGGEQIKVYPPTIQHLLPQILYVNIDNLNRGYKIPDIELYPFSELNNLHTYLSVLNKKLIGDKIPNKSSTKPKPSNLNLKVIRLFTTIFYRQDWKLYRNVVEKWKVKQKPLTICFEEE